MTAGRSVRVIISEARFDPVWDEFVASVPGGDHVQTSAWARTKATQGYTATRIKLEADGRIIAGAQVLRRGLPAVGAFGYVPRGPVVFPLQREPARLVIEQLKVLARRRRIRHLVVQPGRQGDWIAELLPAAGLVPSAIAVAPTATLLVELEAPTEELFANITKSARKHVRRGLREGIHVRQGTRQDLERFHELVVATADRHGFTPYSLDYFTAMWDAFDPSDHLRLFIAEFDRETISAHLVVPFGDVLLSKVVAWSGKHARIYPNEVLEWHVIEWAKAHGFRAYDLEGMDRHTAEQMLASPTADVGLRNTDTFKLKFGGRPVLLPTAFDYFPSALLAGTYGRGYRVAFSGGWPKTSLARLRTRTRKKSPA